MKLRLTRIIISIIAFCIITCSLSWGATRLLPGASAWLERVQFMPAALTFSLTTIVIWLVVTLLLGRVYCSTVCPLGTFQDIMARLPRLKRRPGDTRGDYHYSPPLTRWRVVSLGAALVVIALSVAPLISLFDPYSLWTRGCKDLLRPALGFIADTIGLGPVKIALASLAGVTVTTVVLVIVGTLAWRNGRTYCNAICPVGTALGFVSRYSLLHIDINTDLCTQCRKCEQVCKASCIDLIDHVTDGSRCVMCFDCLPVCPNDAIRYTVNRHQLSYPLMQRTSGPLAGPTATATAGEAKTVMRHTAKSTTKPDSDNETIS